MAPCREQAYSTRTPFSPLPVVCLFDTKQLPTITTNDDEKQVSHLSNALFEFNCLGELPLPATVFGDEADPEEPVDMDLGEQDDQASSSSSSSASPWLRSSSPSGGGTSSETAAIRDDDDASAVGAAAIAAAYPTAFPRVLPSGCAFEASLDGAEFEAVPNTVGLSGLSNGDHRFSVRYDGVHLISDRGGRAGILV